MTPLRKVTTALLAAPLVAAPFFAAPAYSQTDQTASLLEALSLVSGRMLVAPIVAPEVTRDGDRFHVHIPIPKLTSPPDAAIEVTATPLEAGVWDITDLTLPAAGGLVTPGAPSTPPVSLRFTIGQQTAHARIDPTLTLPSPYAVAFSDIAFHIDSTVSPTDLTIGQVTLDGTLTGDAGGRMTTRSHSRVDDWHLNLVTNTGAPVSISLRNLNVLSDIDGLDRAKMEHLRESMRVLGAIQKSTPVVPGQPPSMSPAMREQLRGMVEASTGLLTGLNIEETFQGLHFAASGGKTGDIGKIRLAIASEATDDRVAAHFDLDLDDMTMAAVPAQFVQYVPRHVAFRTAISGIQAEGLRHFLIDTMAEGVSPADRQAKAIALLNEPGAHAGIDTLTIESGPMLIQGSARVRPLPDGTAAFDIHLTAHGLDAMLALIQSDPKAQQILPMLFMAKGMGKQEGGNVVWDIGVAHGRVTINGVPMGQNAGAGGESGVRPPANR
jgi:hypothetical protein